jgi:hypothetical protein
MWNITASQADLWFSIANVVLIIGAALVLMGTIGAIIMANVREEFANERISTNEVETQHAIARGEEAKAEAAQANARAAEANKIAEEERLARIKIEERLAPRNLSDEQRDTVSKKISKYPNVLIDILQLGDSGELQHMRLLLSATFKQANWRTHEWIVPGSDPIIGLAIGVSDTATEIEKNAAHDLLIALKDSNLLVNSMPTFKAGAHTPEWPGFVMGEEGVAAGTAQVRIYIGIKP